MTNTGCRIGKVTYKKTNISSFPDRRLTGNRADVLNAARQVVDEFQEIDGYVLLAWEKPKGGRIKVFCVPGVARDTLDMPYYVGELIRWSWEKG